MNEIVAEVLQVFALKITEQHAVIKVGQLPVLAGSLKSRLFQLMQNLIGNALKYQGGKIWVVPNLPAGSVFYFTIRKTN